MYLVNLGHWSNASFRKSETIECLYSVGSRLLVDVFFIFVFFLVDFFCIDSASGLLVLLSFLVLLFFSVFLGWAYNGKLGCKKEGG